MFYSMLKPLLFSLAPETAHHVTLHGLRLAEQCGITQLFSTVSGAPCNVLGLSLPNPIGLAAGLDKNGEYIDALAALGFGFIEVGTVTRKPQPGNPRPRLFRLVPEQAIINRMGFNNKGVDYLITQLQKTKYTGVLGINIGKNRDTPLTQALDDYIYLFNRVAPFASYIVINISSPNTENLRDLQHGDLLQQLLRALKQTQAQQKKYVPLVVKMSPDVSTSELATMATVFLQEKVDGVIATNTTVSRQGVEASPYAKEIGGLSGKPLTKPSTDMVKQLNHHLQNQIPIIASGGVMSMQDAQDKIAAGASLVQVYTGLIYGGPGWLRTLVKACQ